MAKKRLPMGFNSWLEFHDWLKNKRPELFKEKTIRFKFQKVEKIKPYLGETTTTYDEYTISIAALERLCWKEIEQYRLEYNQIHHTISALAICSGLDAGQINKVTNFLIKTKRNNFI